MLFRSARRHGDLVAELSTLQVFLAGREISSQRARLVALAGDRLQFAESERTLRAELTQLDVEVMGAESELAARGDTDLSDEMVRVEQLRERARGLAAVIVERRRSLERDRGQLMDSGVVANLEAEANRLRAEVVSVIEGLGLLGPEADELAAEEAIFLERRSETLQTIEGMGSVTTAASAAAEVRGELRSMRTAVERADIELRRLQSRVEALAQRAERLDGEIVRLRNECETSQSAEAELVAAVETAEASRIAAEASHDSLQQGRQQAAEVASRWRARAEALQQALEGARARAGADQIGRAHV